jgi:hypothetical protein
MAKKMYLIIVIFTILVFNSCVLTAQDLSKRNNTTQRINPPRIDFANFSYPWFGGDGSSEEWKWMYEMYGSPISRIELKEGSYRFQDSQNLEDDSEGYLAFISVHYGDLDGDQYEEAAVDLLRGSGGTDNWHYLYVYKLNGKKPFLLGCLRSGARAYGGLVNVKIQNHKLILDFNDADLREGDCCSVGIIRVSYRFENGCFMEISPRVKRDQQLHVYK